MMESAKRQQPLSDQLREAVQGSKLSRYQIAKETGIAQSTLCLFCSGKRGLSMKAIDSLVGFFGWQIRKNPRRQGD
jgi:hypothetical protein